MSSALMWIMLLETRSIPVLTPDFLFLPFVHPPLPKQPYKQKNYNYGNTIRYYRQNEIRDIQLHEYKC